MYNFIRLGKTTLLLVMSVLLFFTAASCSFNETRESKVHWLYDWDEALSKAQAENKPVMINFYKDACPACKMLDSNTFSDDELSAFLNDSFVCLKSNTLRSNLYQNYSNIEHVPTTIFATSQGTEFDRIVGYKPPDEFYQYTQGILS